MKPDYLTQIETTDVHCTQKFEHRKGYFIIEADPIMTDENQIVNIEQEYLLIEFRSGGRIDYRDVVFWHANMKQGMLKIVLYDLGNKVVITKMYNTKRPYEYSGWFLISPDYFDGELVVFQ